MEEDHINILRWLANCQDDPSRRDALNSAAQAMTALQSQVAALTAEIEAVRGNALEEAAKVAEGWGYYPPPPGQVGAEPP